MLVCPDPWKYLHSSSSVRNVAQAATPAIAAFLRPLYIYNEKSRRNDNNHNQHVTAMYNIYTIFIIIVVSLAREHDREDFPHITRQSFIYTQTRI